MIKVHTAPAIAICSLGKTSVAHIDFSSFPLFFLVIEIVPSAPILGKGTESNTQILMTF